MKKKILILAILLCMLAPIKVEAKTILVKYSDVTYEYLQEHQEDDIYAYFYGKRTKKNGDGKDRQGYYVNYGRGRVGKKYTTLIKFNSHPKDIDDFEERIDFEGWNKPRLKGGK